MLFVLNNFYVIMLQILWRVSSKGIRELVQFEREFKELKVEDRASKLGLDYFNDDYEVEILRKTEDYNSAND